MVARPFRFGIQQSQASSASQWRDTARRAEALGYDILVIPDHIGGLVSYAPALMAAADATTALRIGTFVLDNDFRHPALVAADTATLDLMSDGRFELGIGAGHLREDYDRSGISFDPPATRVARLEESVEIITSLLAADKPVTFAGQHYTVSELPPYPPPLQRPYPPILIGGGGPRMLTLAARVADIVSLMVPALPVGGLDDTYIAAERVEQQVQHVRREAGERFDHLELNMLNQRVIVTDDRRGAVEELATQWQTTPEVVQDSPYFLIGTADEIVDSLQDRRRRLGVSYIIVFDRYMGAFAPVVARLAGQ